MKKTRIAALLALALTIVPLARDPPAARGSTETTAAARYDYVLETAETRTDGEATAFLLYVERSDALAAPLHAGSISLAADAELTFTPATTGDGNPVTWQTMSLAANTSAETSAAEYDTGKTTDGQSYISFGWYCAEGSNLALLTDARQLLGTLTIQSGNMTVNDVYPLSWLETDAGQALTARLGVDLHQSEYDILVGEVYNTANGLYQGYWAAAEGAEEPDVRVDIGSGWRAFTVTSYDPKRVLTLTVLDEDGKEVTSVTFSEKSGTGRVTQTPELNDLGSLSTGTYSLRVSKPEHVTVTLTGLTVASGDVFPQLKGVELYLPCGDVDGSGTIRQWDRALLTDPARYGKAVQDLPENAREAAAKYDLDGDGRIDQFDLAILTAAENYGQDSREVALTLP